MDQRWQEMVKPVISIEIIYKNTLTQKKQIV